MITSTSNPRVKNLIQLQKKGKARREQQVFVVEGIKMVLEAPKERLKEIYMSESFSKDEAHFKAARKKAAESGCFLEILSDKVFKEASDTMTPQGIMAVVSMKTFTWQNLLSDTHGKGQKKKKLLLVLDLCRIRGISERFYVPETVPELMVLF